MGEIIKLSKTDSVPSLEVMVELESDWVKPKSEFIYLHHVEIELEEIQEEFKYPIEKIEWADNIGRAYIRLDFDRTKK